MNKNIKIFLTVLGIFSLSLALFYIIQKPEITEEEIFIGDVQDLIKEAEIEDLDLESLIEETFKNEKEDSFLVETKEEEKKEEGSKNIAMIASTQATFAAIRPAISICCSSKNNSLNSAFLTIEMEDMVDICTPNVNFYFPRAKDLKVNSVEYTGTICDLSMPSITAKISGHPEKSCDGEWLISEIRVESPCNW